MAPLSARSWKSLKIDPSSIGTFRIRCRLSYVQTMPSGCLLITLPFRVISISFVFIADAFLSFRMEHCTEFRNASRSFVRMHKTFLDHAREISRELHEDGGPVLNAQPESARTVARWCSLQKFDPENRKTSDTLPRATLGILRLLSRERPAFAVKNLVMQATKRVTQKQKPPRRLARKFLIRMHSCKVSRRADRQTVTKR